MPLLSSPPTSLLTRQHQRPPTQATRQTMERGQLTDRGDGGDDFTELQLVQDGGLSGGIKTNHQNPHLLLAPYFIEQPRESQTHVGGGEGRTMASNDSTRSATVSSKQPDATEDRSRTWAKAPGGKCSNVATRRRGENGEMACRGEARVAVDGLECNCGDPRVHGQEAAAGMGLQGRRGRDAAGYLQGDNPLASVRMGRWRLREMRCVSRSLT